MVFTRSMTKRIEAITKGNPIDYYLSRKIQTRAVAAIIKIIFPTSERVKRPRIQRRLSQPTPQRAPEELGRNLRRRAMSQPQTFNGKLLIALNPCEEMPLYSDDVMWKYRTEDIQSLPPHIFSIGISALNKMNSNRKSQCIVITGVSGSGKSVTANYLTQFLYGDVSNYAEQINTVLDYFGNCETAQNHNSSRFVKLLKVYPAGEHKKIQISYQLFEKSRLPMQCKTSGTNFNVFYSLFNAPMDMKDKLKITHFSILPTKEMNMKNSFAELDSALKALGSDMRESIYTILAAILHLGNVNFTTNNEDFAQISDGSKRSVQYAADLLHTDANNLEQVLLQRTMNVSSNQNDSILYV
ncbi:unconventional myosin-Id-like [Sitodiplosis mosellana]|uniref:unconventional myosin-Id-like n=1 Tax=Sitodiplosis mosellana TaxID=263140 RepID=UPI002444D409|nr:unconventional myosin-Id-like [Sitodiplosis mosellana]